MADPVLGGLYESDLTYLPPAQQPNGVGTPVTSPLQTQGEHSGRIYWGCGHSLMQIEAIMGTYQGQPAMLIRCPICGYLGQIIQPPSLFYTQGYQQFWS